MSKMAVHRQVSGRWKSLIEGSILRSIILDADNSVLADYLHLTFHPQPGSELK